MRLPDAAVQESRERVRAAVKSSGCDFPMRRVTVNLTPADLKKEGPAYDLPIALAVVMASQQVPDVDGRSLFLGELGLDGDVRRTDGILPMRSLARDIGNRRSNRARATQANTAAQHNVPLSLSSYLVNPDPGNPTHSVTYATLGGQQLQLDVWQADRPGPGHRGVVWAHGGGWLSGDRANWSLPKWGRWLADQGITMFSVDHRLPATGSMSALTPAVKAQEAADVKCALGWVQAHAADYQVDPSNLVLAGDSSGAHLAMLTAYTIGTTSVPPSCPVTVAPVKAVVSLYQQQAESEVSPISYIRRGLPPTLLIQGSNDHVVPPDYAPRMASQLAASGDEYQLVQLPFTDHVFDIFWGSSSTATSRNNNFLVTTHVDWRNRSLVRPYLSR